MQNGLIRALLVVAALAGSSPAFAAGPATEDPASKVRFSADRLELDTKHDRLELDGNVVVTVDRYRLTSDKLSLERGPRGVVVEGGGRVAFCPCPNPPLTLGFRSATVAPPTDLLLEQPTLRAFGVPFFWLPYLWLRSPRRFGLLPLEVAYRGADGFFLGSGVHVPVADGAALDVGAGVYFEGGAQVDARLVTARTATAIRWDHKDTSAVTADLRGVSEAVRGATVAWSVDALRGGRALGGPALLEDVALRQDRARLAMGTSDGKLTAGVEGAAAAARGGALDGGYAWAPRAVAAFGTALGRWGMLDAGTSVSTWRTPTTGAVSLVSERFELRGDARAGPVRFGAEARSRGTVTLGESAQAHTVASGFGLDVSLPLVREFDAAGGTQHWIVPFADGLVALSDSQGVGLYQPLSGNGGVYAASAGLRTTVGEIYGDRAALSLTFRVSELGRGTDAPLLHAAWLAAAQARLLGLRSEGVVALQNDHDHVSTSALRVGAESGFRLIGRAANRKGTLLASSRLLQGGWDAPFVPWFNAPGWSVGGGAVVPWTRFLASAADVDYDATASELLGVRGTLGYRHPCRCLAVAVWGSHRLGRSGVDAWITVDLMP